MAHNPYWEAISHTSVLQDGHAILNSGRHTDKKALMDRLSGYAREYGLVMSGIKQELRSRDLRVVIGVPNGARDLLHPSVYPPSFLTVDSIKTAPRQFEIRWIYESLIRQTGRIAIFEDVVTTGASPAAMADTVRKLNPDAELHLFGILRRDELLPEFSEQFASRTFLAEEHIPSWPAEDCLDCPLT